MCIVLIKPNYTDLPTKSQLKICWDDNNDGAGFSWYNSLDNNWKTTKALMTWEDFVREWDHSVSTYELDTKTVILHFRIATSGPEDGTDTHPFPLEKNTTIFSKVKFVSKGIVFHNGVFSQGSKEESDTQQAVQQLIWPLLPAIFKRNIYQDDMSYVLDTLLKTTSNRWVIANNNVIHLYGKWLTQDNTGHLFSNNRYEIKNTYGYLKEQTKSAEKWVSRTYNFSNYNFSNKAVSTTSAINTACVSLSSKVASLSRYLDEYELWSWNKWDNRYADKWDAKYNSNEEPVKDNLPAVYVPNGVYGSDNKLLWYLKAEEEEKEETNPIELILCSKCGLSFYEEELDVTNGKCPACFTQIVEEDEDEEWIKDETSWNTITGCPLCTCTKFDEIEDKSVSKDTLETLRACKYCYSVYGVGVGQKKTVLGYKDTKTGRIEITYKEQYDCG